jgi:hypothetical protein
MRLTIKLAAILLASTSALADEPALNPDVTQETIAKTVCIRPKFSLKITLNARRGTRLV